MELFWSYQICDFQISVLYQNQVTTTYLGTRLQDNKPESTQEAYVSVPYSYFA